MFNYFEKITRVIYKEWKSSRSFKGTDHPDEEFLACFIEDKLSRQDIDLIQKHILSCSQCAQYLSIQLKMQPHLNRELPALLLEKVKKLVDCCAGGNLLEIFLKLKDKVIEIVQTTGDVLVGQEVIPATILRSRKKNEFKEEVSILKGLAQAHLLAKIENKDAKSFNLTITVKDNLKAYKNLRITLIKDGIELESYITDSASSFFENILPGDYTVKVSREEEVLVTIDLKVKA